MTITIEKPADIAPAVELSLRHFIGWLERRRKDELWINDSFSQPVVEFRQSEIDEMIRGLTECAKWLGELRHSPNPQGTSPARPIPHT